MGTGKKKIENLQASTVCFSKRREGLFKKASEISRLFPNVCIAAVVISPAGKHYVYGDFGLTSEPDLIVHQSTYSAVNPENDDDHHQLVLSKIKSMLSIDHLAMGLDELGRFYDELKAAKMEFARCIHDEQSVVE